MTAEDDNFISRWSRRKLEARERSSPADEAAKGETEAPVSSGEALTREQGKGEPELIDASEFEDIDFDKLDYNADYTRFMRKGVPEVIQRRALRALWNSDPVLANLDGLNDYDEDFTDAALAVDALKSAYQAGRGYLSDEKKEAPESTPGEVAQTSSAPANGGSTEEAAAPSHQSEPPPEDAETS